MVQTRWLKGRLLNHVFPGLIHSFPGLINSFPGLIYTFPGFIHFLDEFIHFLDSFIPLPTYSPLPSTHPPSPPPFLSLYSFHPYTQTNQSVTLTLILLLLIQTYLHIYREWTAYIDDLPELEYLVSKQTDCKLKIVGDPFFFSGYGIALQKNSTWNARLSLAITKLVRDGFIQQLESKWMPLACGDSVTPSIDKMGINDIGGAFLIVAFGCIICGMLLGVEYAIWQAMAGRARSINEETAGGDASQTLSTLTKVFTLWDANSSVQSAAPAGATLSNFKTLTQQRHLGGFYESK